MIDREAVWLAHQRARFMRPDAYRYMRPDAARFLIPGTDPSTVYAALDRKYSPSQRRIPAGQTGGGRWTNDEGGGGGSSLSAGGDYSNDENGFDPTIADDSGLLAFNVDRPVVMIDTSNWIKDTSDDEADFVQVASDGTPITDIDGSPYYAPGGHHEMPRGVYKNWDLSPETRKVFDHSTTGTLPKERVPINEDSVPRGHYWGGSNGAHGQYNSAVRELSEQFMQENHITPQTMTPDQARQLLKEIRESDDFRIRDYNRMIRLLRRIFRFRGGRE